jgi:hypothetical protein
MFAELAFLILFVLLDEAQSCLQVILPVNLCKHIRDEVHKVYEREVTTDSICTLSSLYNKHIRIMSHVEQVRLSSSYRISCPLIPRVVLVLE